MGASVVPKSTGLRPSPPCTIVIFGAAGDLTKRKLLPALYNLKASGLLPRQLAIVGVTRKEKSHEQFREEQSKDIREFATRAVEETLWEELRSALYYQAGEFTDPETYTKLKALLEEVEKAHGTEGNVLFYLATPPNFFGEIVKRLGEAGLARSEGGGWRRVVVEKPFGRDLDSARALNVELGRVLDESQIYRIDHYLGKETVQNIMVFRFANGLFEPVWDRRYVDHVQIMVAETVGVEDRGNYYETAGVVRDMIENHMFPLLTLVAMEPPTSFHADAVRDEKVKVLKAVRSMKPEDVLKQAVRGQYGPGVIDGQPVPGYRSEPKVSPSSNTETYAALRLHVENWRWAGVPFYLRTGKRLARKVTEIAVTLKPVPHMAFSQDGSLGVLPNQLILTLQPNEGVSLQLGAKIPGTRMIIRPVNMEFLYGTAFLSQSPEAYERLITDAMRGDATLFTRDDEVEAQWRICDPIVRAWAAGGAPLSSYEAGSQGPEEAGGLLRT